ncbi:MAG: cyclic nucleotide-binding domain-containing protein [Acidiphilium sp.]|nr:cyclic nucleotide-binding domain-containing protein [Acidiphilium sp.]MDD4934501.1 cyclic nucleotide-binding domain-containing protein [Acidiphilium sp.]
MEDHLAQPPPDRAFKCNIGPEHEASAHCDTCAARHIGLCDAMIDADLSQLATVAHWCRIPKGHIFLAEGDPAQNFFNLNRGNAKLFKNLPDGRRQIVGFVAAGDFIGLAANNRYSFTAEALTDVRLCRFDRAELRALFMEFPILERRLLEAASRELVVAQAQMLLLGRKSAMERLATFLLNGTTSQGSRRNHTVVTLPMPRSDVADYLGLTIETVSRTLTTLKQRHVIEISCDYHISITDRLTLTNLAAGLS